MPSCQPSRNVFSRLPEGQTRRGDCCYLLVTRKPLTVDQSKWSGEHGGGITALEIARTAVPDESPSRLAECGSGSARQLNLKSRPVVSVIRSKP